MPLVVALLSGLCTKTVVVAFLSRVAVALGVSVLTYSGVAIGMNALITSMSANFNGVTGSVAQFLALCAIPQALNVITSSFVSALALKGLTGSGVLRKIVWGGTGGVFTS